MSQNKTIVPGVDYDNVNTNIDESFYAGLYCKSDAIGSQKTYIPGMGEEPLASSVQNVSQSKDQHVNNGIIGETRMISLQNRVVVGVLFSVSRGLLGEIFPLYLGRNLIGKSQNCDVCLHENTVSSEHAILYIRKNNSIASHYDITLTDYNSQYGSTVNDEDGRYETLSVKENDILTIGRHYKFIIKIFDVDETVFREDEEFEDSNEIASMQIGQGVIENDFYAPSNNQGNSNKTVIS